MELIFPYFVFFIFGTFVGSFINVLIYRIPRYESFIFPSSHCTRCGKILGFFDLIPVLSWIGNGGRCHYCAGRVSFIYPFVEILEGFIFMLAYHLYGGNPFFVAKCIVMLSFFVVISALDIKFQIIPDGMNLSLFLTGAAFSFAGTFLKVNESYVPFFDSYILDGLFASFAGGGFLWAIGFLGEKIFKRPAMGGGDVKLAIGLGFFVGYKILIAGLFLSFFLGAFFGILLMIITLNKKSTYIPFGPYIFFSVCVVYIMGEKNLGILWRHLEDLLH
ncbi:prepilin peptidase [bacterium]|nr:prepilin peptidase [bacterium]